MALVALALTFLGVLMIILVFSLFRKLFRVAVFVGLVLLVVVLFASFLLAKDLRDLSAQRGAPKLYVLVGEGEPLVAVESGTDDPRVLGEEWLAVKRAFPEKLDTLDYYKVTVIDRSVIESLSAMPVTVREEAFPFDAALGVMFADDPLPLLVSLQLLLPEGFEPPSELSREEQGLVFQQAFFSVVLRERVLQDSSLFYGGLKERAIVVYPETPFYRLVRFVPKSILIRIGR